MTTTNSKSPEDVQALSQRIAKLARLLDALHTLRADFREKEAAVLHEMEVVANGGLGLGRRMSAIERAFSDGWAMRYGAPYYFSKGIDRSHLKRLMLRMPDADILSRVTPYLRTDNPFYAKNRHSFAIFMRDINAQVPEAMPTSAAARGCDHVPCCLTDAEHTQRRNQDIRGGDLLAGSVG